MDDEREKRESLLSAPLKDDDDGDDGDNENNHDCFYLWTILYSLQK